MSGTRKDTFKMCNLVGKDVRLETVRKQQDRVVGHRAANQRGLFHSSRSCAIRTSGWSNRYSTIGKCLSACAGPLLRSPGDSDNGQCRAPPKEVSLILGRDICGKLGQRQPL